MHTLISLIALIALLCREIGTVFDHLAEDSDIRSIVLSGNGKAFCAGIDLKEGIFKLTEVFQNDGLDVARKARELRKLISSFQNDFTAIEKVRLIPYIFSILKLKNFQCPKPVISAVHGFCIGAGINMIAACDIRYSSNDAIYSIKVISVISPARFIDYFFRKWILALLQMLAF